MNLLPLTFFQKKKKKKRKKGQTRKPSSTPHPTFSLAATYIISAYSLLELSQLQHCLDHPNTSFFFKYGGIAFLFIIFNFPIREWFIFWLGFAEH